jgi:transposase
MSTHLVNVDRDTPLLLPQDLREWVSDDDVVHFVIQAIDEMKLGALKVNVRGSGSDQYPPKMMLMLLIYCYLQGYFSSRRIERATYRDVSVRFLTADTHPDHDTICTFRRQNFDLVAEVFLEVLKLAKELGFLKVGGVSLDGTYIQANASKHKSVSYERAGEIESQLKLEIAGLMAKAEEMDNQKIDDGQKLPESIAHRDALKERMAAARKQLEERAKARFEAEKAAYDKKKAERQERRDNDDPPQNGNPRSPSKPEPRPEESINLTDPDSRLMRKTRNSAYSQSYNAQAVVDAEGSMLILAAAVTQNANDSTQLERMAHAIDPQIGTPSTLLADTGYKDADAMERLEKEGMELFIAVNKGDNQDQRRYDYRPTAMLEKAKAEAQKPPKDPRLVRMQEKLRTPEGRKQYSKRKQTVEPVFGVIKAAMGFRQCLLRGIKNVSGEWSLVALAYNFRRLWNLKRQQMAKVVPQVA